MTITRRAALRSTAAIIPAALAACGIVSTSPGQITINIAQVNAWATAFINAANLVVALPGIAGTPTAATISGVGAVASSDLAAFTATTGGAISLTFSSASVPAALQSLLADGNTLLADVKGALGGVASTAAQTAQTYITALQTIVALFNAAMSISVATQAAAATAPMSEAKALATLGVK